jgi:competence protein ComEC
MASTAKDIIIPPAGVFRVVFLYVGQGDAAILVIPDGAKFKYALLDNNIDRSAGGIDTAKLLKDLLDGYGKLDVFMNTHPHADHTEGLEAINEKVGVKEVWHSGHNPGKGADNAYQEMRRVISAIGKENEYRFYGTNTRNRMREASEDTQLDKKLGDISFQVLAPAEYLCDEIAGEDPKARRRRIHEHCAVVRFSYGNPEKHILMTGDADRVGWEKHIVDYYADVLPAQVLSAVHHGSRTFFKHHGNDNDVYEKHIEKIKPTYLIVSAPKQKESAHEHPHDDAMTLYKKHVKSENTYHTGAKRESVLVDIYPNGSIEVTLDTELVKAYGFDNEDGDEGSKKSFGAPAIIGSRTSSIDSKPMG